MYTTSRISSALILSIESSLNTHRITWTERICRRIEGILNFYISHKYWTLILFLSIWLRSERFLRWLIFCIPFSGSQVYFIVWMTVQRGTFTISCLLGMEILPKLCILQRGRIFLLKLLCCPISVWCKEFKIFLYGTKRPQNVSEWCKEIDNWGSRLFLLARLVMVR